jgi:methyl-accepting chemotaxis protein
MGGAAGAISRCAGAMKADLVSEQQRLETESNAIIGATERLIVMLAFGGTLLGAILALLAKGTREAATNIVQVNRGATETGSTSEEVLNSAKALSSESTRLRAELDRFMQNIRAA